MTTHLTTQWARAVHRLGLGLDPDWSPSDGLPRDVHGPVTTYQQVATAEQLERRLRYGESRLRRLRRT